MKKPQIVAIVVGVVLVLGAVWYYVRAGGDEESPYRFAAIERGDLEAAVSATGTLGAVKTVQVGTQVSGMIAALYTDFNSPVKKGQLIARIDPVLQQQAVSEAQAGLERNRAELENATLEYERNRQLFERKVLTEIEFNTAKYALAVARANVKSAQVNLDRARRNLQYTSIEAPIDGIVVERNVDVGQTVAASLSAPQLFLIANDLSQLQILASVDESDIGQIKVEQAVRFSVQAYPNENFSGTVQQVRLQSKTTENVVSYTVVVNVPNPTGKLLPGMTATVEFLTGSARDVLMVPNAALRLRPTQAMIAEMRAKRASRDSQIAGSAPATPRSEGEAAQNERTGARRPADAAQLWYLDSNGELAVARVRTGLSDGQRTEVRGDDLSEGLQVIVGVTQTSQAGNSTSPFQPARQNTPMGPPGAF